MDGNHLSSCNVNRNKIVLTRNVLSEIGLVLRRVSHTCWLQALFIAAVNGKYRITLKYGICFMNENHNSSVFHKSLAHYRMANFRYFNNILEDFI